MHVEKVDLWLLACPVLRFGFPPVTREDGGFAGWDCAVEGWACLGTSRTLRFSLPLPTSLQGRICIAGLKGDIGGSRSFWFCHLRVYFGHAVNLHCSNASAWCTGGWARNKALNSDKNAWPGVLSKRAWGWLLPPLRHVSIHHCVPCSLPWYPSVPVSVQRAECARKGQGEAFDIRRILKIKIFQW